MANEALIKGEGAMRRGAGFVDYGAKLQPTKMGRSQTNSIKAEQKAKAAKEISTANSYMDQLKSDVDFTEFDPETQKQMRGYLIEQRDKYAYAASQVAKIQDHTSPEYQYYIDEMNSVKQGFSTLSSQVNAYKENKTQYAELTRTSQWSNAAADEIAYANSVFGLSESKAPISIASNGKLMFGEGEDAKYFDDFRMPTMKDYKGANQIMSLANNAYNSGVPMNPYAKDVAGSKIDALIAQPETLKSLLAGDFDSDGFSFEGIEYDPNNIEGVRAQVKERVLNGIDAAAREGKAYKDAQRGKRGSGTNRGGMTSTQIEAAQRREKAISQIQAGGDKPIPVGRRNKSGAPLFVTLNKDIGKWILTDAAGAPVKGAGDNMLTFDTEEQLEAYIK